MLFTSNNWQDIQKYYEQSYVKFPKDYGDKLYFIYKVRPEAIMFRDSTEEEGILWLNESDPYELDYILPHKSMFQYDQYCLLLSRIPAKQYSRGLTSGNCQFQMLDSKGKWSAYPFGWGALDAYTNKPMFRSIADVLRDPQGRSSEALSKRLAIANNMLFCDTTKIGRIDPDKKILYVSELFQLEVTKLLETTYATPYFSKVVTYK